MIKPFISLTALSPDGKENPFFTAEGFLNAVTDENDGYVGFGNLWVPAEAGREVIAEAKKVRRLQSQTGYVRGARPRSAPSTFLPNSQVSHSSYGCDNPDCKLNLILQIASGVALIVLNILGITGVIPSITLLVGLNIAVVSLLALSYLFSDEKQENGKVQKFLIVAFALASLVTNGATFAAAATPAIYQLSLFGIFGALGVCVNSATSKSDQIDR
jgi:hypothetical protein